MTCRRQTVRQSEQRQFKPYFLTQVKSNSSFTQVCNASQKKQPKAKERQPRNGLELKRVSSYACKSQSDADDGYRGNAQNWGLQCSRFLRQTTLCPKSWSLVTFLQMGSGGGRIQFFIAQIWLSHGTQITFFWVWPFEAGLIADQDCHMYECNSS